MASSVKVKLIVCAFLYFVVNLCYTIFSFSLTDPNLVFLKWPPFWNFQQMMWQFPKQNITIVYSFLVVIGLLFNILIYRISQKVQLHFTQWLVLFCIISSPLLISNNALSHDIFNYIFNARMVIKYQVDPHVRVAMDFMYDPWTRFMHNIHTPAPYFYGWTLLSIIPYLAGLEKFILTFVMFKLWSGIGLILSFVFCWLLMKKTNPQNNALLILIMFNPLLSIELISNAHNDGWMIWPALASLLLIFSIKKIGALPSIQIISSISLLLLSASTKYVSITLIPVWSAIVGNNLGTFNSLLKNKHFSAFQKRSSINLFDVSAVLLFLPLLTARSQQFHPWYLSWSLLFVPLMKNRFLQFSLIILSISSLFRYLPWLWNGGFEYTNQILIHQRFITWVPLVLFGVLFLLLRLISSQKSS